MEVLGKFETRKLKKYGTSTIDVNYTSRTRGKWRFFPLSLSETQNKTKTIMKRLAVARGFGNRAGERVERFIKTEG